MTRRQEDLPTDTGHYLWYILDLGYFNVGCVRVTQDTSSHLGYLRSQPPEKSSGFYLYQVPSDRTLTMYHQAQDHLPPCDKDGRPLVDGYIPFDFRTVQPSGGKIVPKLVPLSGAKP